MTITHETRGDLKCPVLNLQKVENTNSYRNTYTEQDDYHTLRLKISKIFFNKKVPIGHFLLRFKVSVSYNKPPRNARCLEKTCFETPSTNGLSFKFSVQLIFRWARIRIRIRPPLCFSRGNSTLKGMKLVVI